MNFKLNEVEQKAYEEFISQHKGCASKFYSAIGGKISITFTPTGLGDIIVVKCNKCGKEKDITDTSNW